VIAGDTHIWNSFINGSEVSFRQLLENHSKSLYHYGSRYTADSELVKDCIQELFIGLWNSRDRLSAEVNPRAYLMASLRRGLHRKMQSREKYLKYGSEFMSDHFDFQISIEQSLIDKESTLLLSRRMAALVDGLPRRQKEVVYLKFFQNLGRDEIANIMGNSPQTVSNLLQMALKKLRLVAVSL